MVSVTTPDNAVVSTSYGANTVTVTDQAGKQRKSVSDALGRLKEVYEAPNDANYNYLTSYLYDPLDNLTKVTQGSQPPREFAYDSLKRLTSATNPESGTVSYQYDANANLTQKIDARSIVTTIAYDALNRPTTKTYSDGTANVAYFYDSQSLPTGAPAFDRGYATGRLVATTYGGNSNGTYFGYDALGRPLRSIQQTGTINYQTTANYNLAGAITSMSYPSGRTITNTYDNAGRLTAFTGYLGDGTQRTYATGISYSSFGGMTQEQFGTNTALYHKLHYNVRGQLYDIRASTLSLAQNEFDWNRGAVVLYYGGTGWGQSGASNNGAGGATRYAFSRRYFDGRGAVARSMVYQGSTDGWSTQDLEYDSMGRAYRSSNPYFAAGYSSTPASASSMFSTTSHFDHLGRVTQVTMPRGDNDNTLLTSVYSSFDGIYTTVTDQAGKVRRQKVDALGRVIRLDEPDLNGNLGDVGSPAQPTSYEYDTLDNLIHIAQGAQHRYLKYDSLARLTHERQVEQDAPWTTSDYVAGNNQWSRKIIYNSHSLIQDAYDARQVRTNFVYDDLNRVKEIHYFGANGQPDPATPDAFYWYDSQTLPPARRLSIAATRRDVWWP